MMDKLISQQAAIDAVVGYTNCENEDGLRAYVTKHSLENGWTGGIVDALDAIEQLPSAEPYTTTHDSIPAETGKNDGDGTSGDCISRQAAKDIFTELYGISAIGSVFDKYEWTDICETTANELPSVQPKQNEMIKEIRRWINSGNRGNADYFIVDKIEEIINAYEIN